MDLEIMKEVRAGIREQEFGGCDSRMEPQNLGKGGVCCGSRGGNRGTRFEGTGAQISGNRGTNFPEHRTYCFDFGLEEREKRKLDECPGRRGPDSFS